MMEQHPCSAFPMDDDLFADCYTEERTYGFCGHVLKITQSFSTDLGVAGSVWDSAVALCRYFEEQKISFCGRKVIELGAGTGIVGILAVLLGGDVTFTDLPHALKEIKSNILVNVPSSCIHRSRFCALSWGHDHTRFPSGACTLKYRQPVALHAYCAANYCIRYLSPQSATVYLLSKMRREHGTVSFYEEILPQHFQCRLLHRNEKQSINLYKVTQQEPCAGEH